LKGFLILGRIFIILSKKEKNKSEENKRMKEYSKNKGAQHGKKRRTFHAAGVHVAHTSKLRSSLTRAGEPRSANEHLIESYNGKKEAQESGLARKCASGPFARAPHQIKTAAQKAIFASKFTWCAPQLIC
jgi:hypothetical protein